MHRKSALSMLLTGNHLPSMLHFEQLTSLCGRSVTSIFAMFRGVFHTVCFEFANWVEVDFDYFFDAA